MKYVPTFIIALIFATILYAGIQRSTGIVGRTEKNGVGCTCHNPVRDNSVLVQITGPDTLVKGGSAEYQVTLSGGPAVLGGFNVASYLGTLNPVDASTQLMTSELTHTSPKSFSGGSVSWIFSFTANNSVYTDTIYSTSNSVNGDGINSSLDKWNFGQKFVVHVIDEPSSVDNEKENLSNFILNQNYPNPFNPTTTISWQSKIDAHQTLKVFDALGNEVATLVDEYKSAGDYSEQVTMAKEQLSSGIYFYQLKIGNYVESKKMILMKWFAISIK